MAEHKVTIDLKYAEMTKEIKKHLSIIGSRAREQKSGQSQYSDIMLSNLEEPILYQYINEAAGNILTMLKQLASNLIEKEDDGTLSFDVTNTRWTKEEDPSPFAEHVARLAKHYAIDFSVAEYLKMYFPEYSEKYAPEAQRVMSAIIELVFYKVPPDTTKVDFLDAPTVSITDN